MPPFLAAIIGARLATMQELKTTLTLDDAWALCEVLLVRQENERRAYEAANRE